MPQVSVIVPVYNSERYLNTCINSLINQSLKDIEIIIVNDGSNDNSLVVCQKYEKMDQRIKLINKQNGGVSSARNEGIRIATGEYIGFVDSDDWVDLDTYEKMYSNAGKHNVDAVVIGIKKFFNKKENTRKMRLEGLYNSIDLLSIQVEDGSLKGMLMSSTCNTLYRTEIIKSNSIVFNESLKINEDGIFNFDFLIQADKVYFLPNEFLYHHRLYNNHRIVNNCWEQLGEVDNILKVKARKYPEYNLDKQIRTRQIFNAIVSTINECKSDKSAKSIINNLDTIYSSRSVREGINTIEWNKISTIRKLLILCIKYKLTYVLYLIFRYIKS
jgi:glycosyltransferase involved in cell wall biosynthesis